MHAERGKLLLVTEKCAIITNDRDDSLFVGLGHHLYDDVELLSPGDICLVLKKEKVTVESRGMYAKSDESDISLPVHDQWVECGKNYNYCYLIYVKGYTARILETYIENADMGLEAMSCVRFIQNS